MDTEALTEAKTHLSAWKAADLALATGKTYQIGSRQLTRADAIEVKERILYWQKRVNRLSGKVRRKLFFGVPTD